MKESRVTQKLAQFLKARGWTVLAMHCPGAQLGMYFHRADRTQKGAKGSIIVDLVARKKSTFLLAETKSTYDSSDLEKLQILTSDPTFAHSLARKLDLGKYENPRLLRAIAVHEISLERATLPSDFLVFQITQEEIKVMGTFIHHEEISTLFPEYESISIK